jgi:hypothetical protein
MKIPSLLLIVTATGLFAADAAKSDAPAAAAPATAASTPTEAPKKSKVPGVSDEDYQKYINTRVGIENNDPEIKALKAAADAAEAKVKAASKDDKAAAEKEFKAADKAFKDARAAAVLKKSPELADVAKKITDFWVKEAAAKEEKSGC